MFKITIDDDAVFENVMDYRTEGGRLIVLKYANGVEEGYAGFINYRAERVDNPNAT